MQGLIDKIKKEFDEFIEHATLAAIKGTKTSARAARVKSVSIGKLLKEFRDVSLNRKK